jgi:plasmid stability protein
MVNLNYEIPDELHRQLKVRAAEEGITLKELVIRLLADGLKRKDKQ